MNNTRRAIISRAAALAAASAMPSLSFGQSTAQWASVIEAAKREGKVTFYTSAVGSPFHRQIGSAFEKEYGIKFEALEARASELRERIRAEQTAGRFLGDVHYSGGNASVLMAREGAFDPHRGVPNLKDLQPGYEADEFRIPANVHSYGILVNKNLVKPADEPKSWKDLLDPKWKGKILSDDMRALGVGYVFFATTYAAFGRDFHEKLAAQKPLFSRNLKNDEMRVARGEYPIYIPELLPFYAQLKGLPVNFVVPQEGRPYVRFDMSVLKNAPRPNAARLFINFMLGAQAQLIYANAGFTPTIKGVIEKSSDDVRSIFQTKLLGTTDPDKQDEMLSIASSIYK